MILHGLLLITGMVAIDTATTSPSVIPPTPAQNEAAYAVGKMLRCPVCQGMPISESPSQMAQDMMERVRELQREGKSDQEIFDYFVDRYGEWVLLRPKATGMNLALWLLPALALLVGVFVIARHARRRAEPKHEAPAQDVAVDATLKAIRDEVNE